MNDPLNPYEVWCLAGRGSDDDTLVSSFSHPDDADAEIDRLEDLYDHLAFERRDFVGPGTDAFYFRQLYESEGGVLPDDEFDWDDQDPDDDRRRARAYLDNN